MGKAKGESRGLAYLQQVRPQAVSHLLRFFRESGQHLEPRPRFLISIVTKVINLSPRGLQQYVRRALAAGASPDGVSPSSAGARSGERRGGSSTAGPRLNGFRGQQKWRYKGLDY